MGHRFNVRRMPLGEGGGGGNSNAGTGAPIGVSPAVVTSQKLPNAVAATAGGSGPVGVAGTEAKPKIQAFNQGLTSAKHAQTWKRKTNVDGRGATHVKSFHCKLNTESVEYMDQQINQWLDEHPDYEVKFTTSSIGEWTGKIKEPAMVVCVWV